MSKLILVLLVCVASVFCGDLNMKNSCGSTLWFEARGIGNNPIPGHPRITRADPGQTISYDIAPGTVSTRFWAKYGCDGNGANCLIGDQVPNSDIYGQQGCPNGGCQAPIDSLFEATWGFRGGNGGDPVTWFDTSSVDGYTIPYKVTFNGPSNKCDCDGNGCAGLTVIDGSQLDVTQCPTNEDMSTNGQYPQFNNENLQFTNRGQLVGCQAPCKKFTNAPIQGGLGVGDGSPQALYYCCPTPNPFNCQTSQGCVTSQECQAGPGATCKYVQAIHRMTNSMVYAYQYDDTRGLHTCPAQDVTYTMEFCPPGSVAYPGGAGNGNTNGNNNNNGGNNNNNNGGNGNNNGGNNNNNGGNNNNNGGGSSNGGCPPGVCPASLSCCRNDYTSPGCFMDAYNTCATNEQGKMVLCPKNYAACGQACYDPNSLGCHGGQLGPK